MLKKFSGPIRRSTYTERMLLIDKKLFYRILKFFTAVTF